MRLLLVPYSWIIYMMPWFGGLRQKERRVYGVSVPVENGARENIRLWRNGERDTMEKDMTEQLPYMD